jgi:predicted choloylglycine hydrolase
MEMVPFTFRSIQELELGSKWAAFFEERWPHYRAWFLRDGEADRPTYATCARMLHTHMPELVPAYERVVELAGGGDLAARMLSCYTPPPYLAACSQGVWTRDGMPMLVRNYDYAPSRFEGVVWSTKLAERRVMGMSDCLWGLLDGMNDAGLAVSLTFGGRRSLGEGFGIPIVVRYLLETCDDVDRAREVLARLPYSLSHNLTIVDRHGRVLTAYLSPDRGPIYREFPAATNHQGIVEWPEQAKATRTIERERCIVDLLGDDATTAEGFVDAFLRAPLFSTAYASGFGTLYTAVYRVAQGAMEVRWPAFTWPLSFGAFEETEHTEVLAEGSVA